MRKRSWLAVFILWTLVAPIPLAAQVFPDPLPSRQVDLDLDLDLASPGTGGAFRVALFGAAAGALIGFGIGYAAGKPTCSPGPCMPEARDPNPARTYAFVGAISGGTVGWLIGLATGHR